jgi:hypothetical protein
MALTLNTKVILVNEDVDLTQRKDLANNAKVEIVTVGDILDLVEAPANELPEPPETGTYFLLSTDGVLSWELFEGGGGEG